MDDFSKYEQMRQQGSSPQDIYAAARADGLDSIARIRLLRKVFALSLTQAKEVAVVAERLGTSLDDHQEKLLPGIKSVLEAHQQNGSNAQDRGQVRAKESEQLLG